MLKSRIGSQSLLIASATLVLTACGGDSSDNPPPAATPAKPISVSTFQAADYVIGQPDFVSNTSPSDPDATNVDSLYNAAGYGNGTLYITDYNYNRILGFNGIPQENNPAANFVLGQPDFTSDNAGNSADQMAGPQSPFVSGNKLFVAEYDNNRVIIFDPAPSDGPASASVVIGQPDFGVAGSDCSATGLASPEVVTVAGNKMIVADTDNDRVLIWNSIPTSNGQPADLVLGQPDFTSCSGDTGANRLSGPSGIWSDGNRLVVQDSGNHRVLIWNTFPTSSGQDADLVLGQSNVLANIPNDDNGDGTSGDTSARTFDNPYDGVASDGNALFITDTGNHRILVWNTFPTESFQPADVVLGQSDFALTASNDDDQDGFDDGQPSARTFFSPRGLTLAANRYLVVSDGENDRALIFDLKK